MRTIHGVIYKLTDRSDPARGFSLLELLLVIAMIGILTAAAGWGGNNFMRSWQLKHAGHQTLEAFKLVQSRAERSAGLIMSNGNLVIQQLFLVFDPAAQSYAAYSWQDQDNDTVAEANETTQLWQARLPHGVSFSWPASINRRACSNVKGPPGSAISFASPTYAPCNDRPCIKFNQHGFSVMGPGAIYLSNGEQAMAITATRPGHLTMCEWDGERWR